MGITLYALISYGNSVDDEDARPVSERFYDAFESIRDRMKKGASYTIVDDDEESDPLNERCGGENMFCPYCGTKINEDFEYCPKCGKRLPEVNA